MSRSGIVALLTDFGHADVYVGVMKGVILGIAPDVSYVDLTHDVPPQDVSTAAWLLSTAWNYLPNGTVFVAVVDPGVGTARRAIAFSAGGRFFVGPDNGIFSDVLAVAPADHVVTLDNAQYYATPRPSATFHGRDIFAPCAAHLIAGVPLASLGAALSPTELVRLGERSPFWEGGTLIARVLYVDHFGNVIINVGLALTDQFLADPGASVLIGGQSIAARALTFGEGPEDAPFILRDSSGNLAVAVRNGSAAALLGVTPGMLIQVVGMRARDLQCLTPPPARSRQATSRKVRHHMRLYFLRHGQAGDQHTWQGDDFSRPLTDEGKAEMEAVAQGLRALNLRPAAVLSSPLVRARQTAEIAARALSVSVTEVPSLAPGCDLVRLAETLGAYRQDDEVLLVGHEPDFSTLIGTLVARDGTIAAVEMRKGTCCRVDLPATHASANTLAGRGTLSWLLTAKHLSVMGMGTGHNAAHRA